MNRLRILTLCTIAALLCCAQLFGAADPAFEHADEYIQHELRAAQTGVRALAVAAHPDDEDGSTLSFLRALGCETHICFSTRGEGGQNEAGPESGLQLAALRTKEIEEAAAIIGAKAWYLNMPDFGFTKSVEETMTNWNHDVALEHLVHVIRSVRPQIVITNHDPDGTDHGHHRTTGKLLVEAFDAAADPAKFPQQLEHGLKPWSISRIYLRTFTAEGSTIHIDLSKRDALSGMSASEIGAFALSRHYSQGMMRDLRVGERELRHFKILKTRMTDDAKITSLLEGISGAPVGGSEAANDATAPEKIAALLEKSGAEAKVHLNRALAAALGLKIEVRCEDAFITAGETAAVSVRAANTGANGIKLKKIVFRTDSATWKAPELAVGKDLKGGEAETSTIEIGAGENAPLSYPLEEHLFEQETSGTPVTAIAEFEFTPAGGGSVAVSVEAAVPLSVAAAFTFTLAPNPLLIFSDPSLANEDKEAAHFKLLARCNKKLKEPAYLAAAVGEKPKEGETGKVLAFNFKGDSAVWAFNQWFVVEKLNAGISIQTFVWDTNGFYKTPAVVVRRVPLQMPSNMRVALVKGVDEQLHMALKRMQDSGVGQGTFSYELPSDEDLLATDLNKYQAIILDIRTTQQRPVIRKLKERLKAFMDDGGTVVCMYQKDFDWNDRNKDAPRGVGFFRGVSGGGEIAPFPIELSFDRVTREDAAVTILTPTHPLLLQPCRIWQKDFENWAQERGAYFPKTWAPEYTALLSSHDPNDKPLDGGLLVADVGRGAFIYTSYFWQHQFRTGVPGAYRMLANMISYSRMKRADKP